MSTTTKSTPRFVLQSAWSFLLCVHHVDLVLVVDLAAVFVVLVVVVVVVVCRRLDIHHLLQ